MGGMIAISSPAFKSATSPAGRYSWFTASANAPLISSREGYCREWMVYGIKRNWVELDGKYDSLLLTFRYSSSIKVAVSALAASCSRASPAPTSSLLLAKNSTLTSILCNY